MIATKGYAEEPKCKPKLTLESRILPQNTPQIGGHNTFFIGMTKDDMQQPMAERAKGSPRPR
jgi:hypothetical protein